MCLQEPSALQPNQLVLLAEAAAKAAEHLALLKFLQLQQHKQQDQQPLEQQQQGAGVGQQDLASALPWYKPLAEARAATGDCHGPISMVVPHSQAVYELCCARSCTRPPPADSTIL
jgi:hypothetical protein